MAGTYFPAMIRSAGFLVIVCFTIASAWPEWPAESHYSGVSYGPTPFWCKPNGLECLNGRTYADNPRGQNTTADLSTTKSVQRINHEFCNLTNFGGPGAKVPCVEYWQEDGRVFIAADNFCCQGYGSPGLFPLKVPQTNWMTKQMKLQRELGYYKGEFYDGKVYNYTMNFKPGPPPSSEIEQPPPPGGGVIHFWYYASYPDKKPVAQGEGCVIDVALASRCVGNAPVYLFTEYRLFSSTTFNNYTEFEIPTQCKDNRKTDCYNKGGGPPPLF
ncbi:uncharacterized protein LOC132543563 [Ylistrum balloti]|uniref:uncharacterized protein LOC132543563 n=1 Tax=Ylistrum balloti TaxID=509963 RepID=UPI002905F762|nr:uncharacterized protein LOC132543563 [Ylistrum balloti]